MPNPVIQSFPPIANARATRLILGSMPGVASLAAGQYYAHRANAFWPIMGELLGFAPGASYSQRVTALLNARIAVWDVLQCCERPGSLDSAILRESEVANDFAAFLAQHPLISEVFFNGGAAEACFARHVSDVGGRSSLKLTRLPSTSSAHAAIRYEQKRDAWRQLLFSAASG